MINNEKENIINLSRLFKEMYKIIESNSYNDVAYGKKAIIEIIEYLEQGLISEATEYGEVINIVIEQYKSMFPPRGGLSEFHIWHDDYNTRVIANSEYEKTKLQIESILGINN